MKLVRVINQNTYKDYTPQDLVQKNVNRFLNWKCSAGSEGIFIDWDGNVWPGTCFVGQQQFLMGNIKNSDDIILHNDFITCRFNFCPCFLEIYLPKYKENEKSLDEVFQTENDLLDTGFDALSRAQQFDKDRKYIMWAFGRKCNFNCSYCDDVSHSKLDSDLVNEFSIEKVKNYAKLYRQNKQITWSFTGGEPTINVLFLDLVKYLHSIGDTITVATNGSASNEYYTELAKYANINISVHFEFLKAEKLRKVTEAIIKSNPEWFGLNFMAIPGRVSKCYEYLQKLITIPEFIDSVHCHFDMLRVKNEDFYQAYSEEDIKILKELEKYNRG